MLLGLVPYGLVMEFLHVVSTILWKNLTSWPMIHGLSMITYHSATIEWCINGTNNKKRIVYNLLKYCWPSQERVLVHLRASK